MTRYGLPIICSIGRLKGCDCSGIYALCDYLPQSKKLAILLLKNPPELGPCKRYESPVDRFIDLDAVGLVDTNTWEVMPFCNEDFNSNS